MKKILQTLVLVGMLITLSSHELFLKAASYFLKPNETAQIYLLNGTFDKSENPITRDRIINAKIIGPDYVFEPKVGNYMDKGNSTYLNFKTGNPGSYVAGISTLPRVLEMTAEDFNGYLEHEGLANTIVQREIEGTTEKSAKEKYSKHVKALLQVGDTKTDDYNIVLGYPIEFIPLNNPYEGQVGDSVSFQLLRAGVALPNHIVHYSTSTPGIDAHDNEKSLKTDANGVLTITPDKSGKWYVATIHMTKSEGEDLDYESNWATLTFEVQ